MPASCPLRLRSSCARSASHCRHGPRRALAFCVVLLGCRPRSLRSPGNGERPAPRSQRRCSTLDAALPRNANVYSLFPEGGPQIDKRERRTRTSPATRRSTGTRTSHGRSPNAHSSRSSRAWTSWQRSMRCRPFTRQPRDLPSLLLPLDVRAHAHPSAPTARTLRPDLRPRRLLPLSSPLGSGSVSAGRRSRS